MAPCEHAILIRSKLSSTITVPGASIKVSSLDVVQQKTFEMDGPSTDSGGATVISESVTAPAEMVTNMALPWPEPSATSGTYDLHCHCATIRLKIKLSPPLYQEGEPRQYTAIQCSCSYCTRTGYIAAYPFAGDVEFTQGLEHRGEYRTGAMKANPFWFCKLCGCVLGGDLTVVMRDVLGLGGETDMRWSVNVSEGHCL